MSNKPNAREAIVDTASRLFFTQGYHATGLNQIIKDSESPKGSLYYYFPHGKEELALTCINRTSEEVARLLRHYMESEAVRLRLCRISSCLWQMRRRNPLLKDWFRSASG